jgi:predicted amidophosphoribosyltransferase
MFNYILNTLFPVKCVGCEVRGSFLCVKCLEKIESAEREFENIFAATIYGDKIIKKAIWLLKFNGIKKIAEPLAELIIRRLPPDLLGNSVSKYQEWLIVPVPLSKIRLKERRFNQAELIAKHLTDKLKAPPPNLPLGKGEEAPSFRRGLGEAFKFHLETNVLYKTRHTDSQVSIKNRNERLNNLKNSFAVKNPHLIKGKNIILVDDVYTTGATITEARKTLKKAGAKKVIVITVAHG